MLEREDIKNNLITLREKAPLIHNITNFVVMNNTANALLAIGASPVMAHAEEEVKDMVKIASALVLNMGTLSDKWVDAMVLAGYAAREKGIPVIFDPVGVGATPYRNEMAAMIVKECKPTIIRGNASEIMALANENISTKGVDSTTSSNRALDSAKELANLTSAVVVISGEVDFITDGKIVYQVKNGHPMMPMVTGMGCTASALIAAFAAVDDDLIRACVSAMATMGITGELAGEKANGPGTMQLHFIDELFNLDPYQLKENAAFNLIQSLLATD